MKEAAIYEEMSSFAFKSDSHLAEGWNHLWVLKSVDSCLPFPQILI